MSILKIRGLSSIDWPHLYTYIPITQALEILGDVPLAYWSQKALIPRDKKGDYILEYLMELHEYCEPELPTIERALFWSLGWHTRHDSQPRDVIIHKTASLRRNGKIVTVREVSILLGRSWRDISNWTKTGFLPSIKIPDKQKRYLTVCLVSDVRRIEKILNYSTTIEVAAQLEIDSQAVTLLVRKGVLRPFHTPNGYRFGPEDLAAYQKMALEEPVGLRWSETLHVLKIDQYLLETWVAKGYIKFTLNSQGHRIYDKAHVMYIKEEREKLRGDFDWLVITKPIRTYNSKTTGRILQTLADRVNIWAREDLLPHFNLTPPEAKRSVQIEYLAPYIDELAAYARAQGKKPSKVLVQAFKEYRRKLAVPENDS